MWRPPPNLPQEVGRGGRRQEAGKGLYIDHTAKMGKLGQELKVKRDNDIEVNIGQIFGKSCRRKANNAFTQGKGPEVGPVTGSQETGGGGINM